MLDAAIASIQRAPLSPDGWSNAVASICQLFESCGGVLFDTGGGNPSVIISPSLERSTEYYVEHGFQRNDLRVRAIPRLLQSGVAFDQELISDAERQKHPYCRDFLDRFSLRWAAVVGFPVQDGLWALSLQRAVDQDPFSNEQLQTLLQVRAHLANAAMLTRVIQTERLNGSLESLDLVGCAAILLDRAGFVLSRNQRARELQDIVYSMFGRRFLFFDASDRGGRFSQSHEAFSGLKNFDSSSKVIRDTAGCIRPVRCIRIADSARHAFTGASDLILIGPPRLTIPEPEAALSAVFGLTASEARLAILLSTGITLSEAGEKLGVTIATARDRLKTIFQKTGTTRQAELVRKLVRSGLGDSSADL